MSVGNVKVEYGDAIEETTFTDDQTPHVIFTTSGGDISVYVNGEGNLVIDGWRTLHVIPRNYALVEIIQEQPK